MILGKIINLSYCLVHFSFAILQNAKLKMMQIIDVFLEHLDCTAMKLCYSDTGNNQDQIIVFEIIFR